MKNVTEPYCWDSGTRSRTIAWRFALRLGLIVPLVLACLLLTGGGHLLPTGGPQEAGAIEYRKPFERQGIIDQVDGTYIVIGDTGYYISGLVRYYTDHTKRRTADRYDFTVGKKVGFEVNAQGEIEVLFFDR